MPRNKDPAVMFYTADFLADTTLWSYDELGRYIKLLCIQHLQDGISEDDFIAVADGCKRVLNKFVQGEDGLFRNARMQEEKEARAKFSKKQSDNGSKGGRPKNPNESQTKAKQKPNESQTETKRKPNKSPRVENENENINGNLNNNISFSFSTTTTTIDDNALPREESGEKKPVMVTNEGGELVPLTDEMLAEIRAQNALEKRIRDYFADNEYISSAELFIQYNYGRGWLAHGDVDIRKGDKWMVYADEWERKERLRQGIT